MSDVVVITGASGGVGRATARLFAQDGAKIALLARGENGLEAAATEVEELGGKDLVLPPSVADAAQVEAAAQAVEITYHGMVWGTRAALKRMADATVAGSSRSARRSPSEAFCSRRRTAARSTPARDSPSR
jgi:NAD(P)-dependent dehydrogenase (short-subunit alcohol dehydrogenase family)